MKIDLLEDLSVYIIFSVLCDVFFVVPSEAPNNVKYSKLSSGK